MQSVFWRRSWSIQEASPSMVVVAGLTSHANTGTVKTGRTICSWNQLDKQKASSTCFKPHVISFRDICVTTTFTPAETNSLKTFIYESHTHIHVLISESMLYTNLLVHYTRLGTQRFPLLCLFPRPCFKPHAISFRGICVTTKLLQQRPTTSRTFIYESHYIREHSYSCLSFWAHALYPLVISLFHMWYS